MSEFRVPEVVVSPSNMALSEPTLDYPHHIIGGASINERRGSRTGGPMFLAPYCLTAPTRRRHSWIGG